MVYVHNVIENSTQNHRLTLDVNSILVAVTTMSKHYSSGKKSIIIYHFSLK